MQHSLTAFGYTEEYDITRINVLRQVVQVFTRLRFRLRKEPVFLLRLLLFATYQLLLRTTITPILFIIIQLSQHAI